LIKDDIVLGTEDKKKLDLMEIAIAIRNSTYEGKLRCRLLENSVVNSCEECNLSLICEGIDEVAQDYVESTTKVVNSFSFH